MANVTKRRSPQVLSDDLLDRRPISLPGFIFRARAVEVVGRPTTDEWENAYRFASALEESSPYWVGALVNYLKTREDWRERISQLMSATGLTYDRLRELAYIESRVAEPERAVAPTIGHAKKVAALTPAEQHKFLTKARDEGMTVRDLQMTIKSDQRRKVIEGQAVLAGQFRVIYANPQWISNDHASSSGGGMTIEQLCDLPVKEHTTANAVLWLWVPVQMTYQNPGPREVLEAWGFHAKAGRVWDKVLHSFGHYVEVRHENLFICTRGSCPPDRPTPMLSSVVTERRSDAHSEKPESFRKDIERLYDGPYLELFGNRPVEGWTVLGNDAALWASEMTKQEPALAASV